MFDQGVLVLCLDIAETDIDGIELVVSDAAVEQLLATGLGVEEPTPAPFDDRHRHRPVLDPHPQDGDLRVVGIPDDLGFFASNRRERLALVAVVNRVACLHEVHAIRPQDPGQRLDVEGLGGDE